MIEIKQIKQQRLQSSNYVHQNNQCSNFIIYEKKGICYDPKRWKETIHLIMSCQNKLKCLLQIARIQCRLMLL